jgi:hypothetical protein
MKKDVPLYVGFSQTRRSISEEVFEHCLTLARRSASPRRHVDALLAC